jgi:hypothetical protein
MDDGPDIEVEVDGSGWDSIAAPPPSPVGPWLRRGNRAWIALALAAVVALVAFGLTSKNSRHVAAAPSTRATTRSSSAPPSFSLSPPSLPAAPTPSAGPAVATVSGPSLLDVPAGWQIFGRTDDSVVRIALKSGQITTTSVQNDSGPDPDSFVVGPDRVLVEPEQNGTGYVILDGQPAQPIAASAIPGGPVLPGPDSEHIWIPSADGSSMVLADLDGRPTGTTLPVQPGSAAADGQGYLVYYDTGGVYDARPSGIHRVTTGNVLAIGPTTWLTAECDEQDRCSTVVIDRASGRTHTIPGKIESYTSSGLISPDGRTAALFTGTQDAPALQVLNLTTGALTKIDITPSQNSFGSGTFLWSPDSQWLFALDSLGQLCAIDRAGTVQVLDGRALNSLAQIALRTS